MDPVSREVLSTLFSTSLESMTNLMKGRHLALAVAVEPVWLERELVVEPKLELELVSVVVDCLGSVVAAVAAVVELRRRRLVVELSIELELRLLGRLSVVATRLPVSDRSSWAHQ